jgi:hypothetical protein
MNANFIEVIPNNNILIEKFTCLFLYKKEVKSKNEKI